VNYYLVQEYHYDVGRGIHSNFLEKKVKGQSAYTSEVLSKRPEKSNWGVEGKRELRLRKSLSSLQKGKEGGPFSAKKLRFGQGGGGSH